MEEWSVAGSGSEEDGEAAEPYLNFGGIRIPPERLLQLMQTVHRRKTVELDSLSDVRTKKRKKKRKKSAPRLSAGGGGGAGTVEDASETASEIKSTTCTSTTATECRDMRRRNYDAMFDDPELDDNVTLSSSKPSARTKTKKAPPLTHKKAQQLARLDKITADKLKRKQRWQLLKSQSELSSSNNTLLSAQKHHASPEMLQTNTSGGNAFASLHQSMMPQLEEVEEMEKSQGRLPRLGKQGGGEKEEGMEVDGENGGLPVVMFDDEDSTDKGESESDSDMKFSLLPQINKVEQLLDFEVS